MKKIGTDNFTDELDDLLFINNETGNDNDDKSSNSCNTNETTCNESSLKKSV